MTTEFDSWLEDEIGTAGAQTDRIAVESQREPLYRRRRPGKLHLRLRLALIPLMLSTPMITGVSAVTVTAAAAGFKTLATGTINPLVWQASSPLPTSTPTPRPTSSPAAGGHRDSGKSATGRGGVSSPNQQPSNFGGPGFGGYHGGSGPGTPQGPGGGGWGHGGSGGSGGGYGGGGYGGHGGR